MKLYNLLKKYTYEKNLSGLEISIDKTHILILRNYIKKQNYCEIIHKNCKKCKFNNRNYITHQQIKNYKKLHNDLLNMLQKLNLKNI